MQELINIMARLRSPDGCPWDREQTHESLLQYLLEESAEVFEASRSGQMDHLKEELGDILLQVVFHAQIAQENGQFAIDDVVRAICDKLIRRHPHVFANTSAETSEAVKQQWEVIKAAERAGKTVPTPLDEHGFADLLSVLDRWGHKRGFDAVEVLRRSRSTTQPKS